MVTPLHVDAMIYGCTQCNRIVALNADTGQERWVSTRGRMVVPAHAALAWGGTQTHQVERCWRLASGGAVRWRVRCTGSAI